MVDESYDPHARMHESFPRVDSGSGYDTLKADMNYDKDLPWQRSMRGLAEGETLKASRVFRKNNDE